MLQVISALLERKDELQKRKNMIEKELETTPEGYLRICNAGNTPQFYLRTNPQDFSGVYIPKSRMSEIKNLAQKEYNKKVLRSIEQELKAIEKYLSTYPSKPAEEVYESLHIERQKLITPIRLTDEQYIREWLETPFQGKEIDDDVPLLYTEKGERVRSKSEVIIADILHHEGVPYKYECPLMLKGLGKVHPDFTMLNVRKRKVIYWEHLGKMDDAEYVESAIRRKEFYERNGIFLGDNLILTFETRNCPLNQRNIRIQIERYLK